MIKVSNSGIGTIHGSRTNGSSKIFAVTAVCIMLLSSAVILFQGSMGDDSDAYEGETHTVRYHLNASAIKQLVKTYSLTGLSDDGKSFSNDYNSGFYGTWDSDESDYYIDVIYYGPIVTTEYNPQFWKETVVTNDEITWNWMEITEYAAGKTIVFTGWNYGNTGSSHYPGEVLSEADRGSDGSIIDIYATWEILDSLVSVSDYRVNGGKYQYTYTATSVDSTSISGITSNGRDNAFDTLTRIFSTDGSAYTNILIIEPDVRLYIRDVTVNKPLTIRTGVGCFDSVGKLYDDGNDATMKFYHPAIIDCVGIRMGYNSIGDHGQRVGGLSANGNPLIIGTGILSYYGYEHVNGYPSIRGGSSDGTSIQKDIDIGVYPEKGSSTISTAIIVHSGTWANVIGGSRNGTITGSTYSVVRSAVVLDTFEGAGATGSGVATVTGSVYCYFTDVKLPGDSYEESKMEAADSSYSSPLPYKYTINTEQPSWPYRIDSVASGSSISKMFIQESSILTGGGCSGSGTTVNGDTHVYISGTSVIWDGQAAGRHYVSPVLGTGNIELSGKAVACHVLCGSITDGNVTANRECVKNTNVIVRDSAKAATVCGGGYDTWADAVHASMMDGGYVNVEIQGGTVCDVYGGGFRGTLGTSDKPLDSITVTVSGGTVLGNVYGGGSGGINKICHNLNGTVKSSDSGGTNNNTGKSYVYAKSISVTISGDACVEESVYGGGKSVPALSYGKGYKEYVAMIDCDTVSVVVKDSAVIKENVFGGGRGLGTVSDNSVSGTDATEYTHILFITPSGEKSYMPWITGQTITLLHTTDANRAYASYAKATVDTISVSIEDSASIGSGVYGAGGRSIATANTVLTLDDDSVVGGSVYGGGLMGKLTGSTDITVQGTASIGSTVFGGADVGDRSSEGSTTELVTGTANIYVDGSSGASIKDNIIGAGNSCTVKGDKTILVEHYKPHHSMKSIQNATYASIVDSVITLTGRANSDSPLPSALMSLYGIEDLRVYDGTEFTLSAMMNGIESYGSYVGYGDDPAVTTSDSPSNSFYMESGLMFNTAYTSGSTEKYGPISGYTTLIRDVANNGGAFAYGQVDSPGGFVDSDGNIIAYIYRASGDSPSHDEFWLWVVIGNVKILTSMVASVGSGDSVTSSFDIMLIGSGTNEKLTLSSASLELVHGITMTDSTPTDENSYRFTVGTDGFFKDSSLQNGLVIPESFSSGTNEANTVESVNNVGMKLEYSSDQSVTGLIGTIILEFLEEEVDDDGVSTPICSIIVEVSLYCIEDTDSFASDSASSPTNHQVMIYLDGGRGSTTFCIPSGFKDYAVNLVGYKTYLGEAEADLPEDAVVTMKTSANNDGTTGWITAAGNQHGTLDECIGVPAGLTGGYIATLVFSASGITDLNYRIVLSFTLSEATTKYFTVEIVFGKVLFPAMTGIEHAHGTDVYKSFTQNSTGTYEFTIADITSAEAVEVMMSDFNGAMMTAEVDEENGMTITVSPYSVSGDADPNYRGTVTATVAVFSFVDNDPTATWFVVSVFIAGPVEDASI